MRRRTPDLSYFDSCLDVKVPARSNKEFEELKETRAFVVDLFQLRPPNYRTSLSIAAINQFIASRLASHIVGTT